MLSEKAWQKWLERLYRLRRDKHGSHERPHKPVLLLAISDLVERGFVRENQVPLSPELVETFRRYFNVVRKEDDKPTIENPFYFLSGDGFWKLEAAGGGRPVYEPGNATSPPSMKVLRTVNGRFDEGFWDLLSKADTRRQVRDALVTRYFPQEREKLAVLAGAPAAPKGYALNEEFKAARDAAFRRTVLELYDYRCAACGIRVKITEELSLVEAAHIIPFGVSRNDKPDNGLALCPNHHWAMDRFLIAPCPDSKSPAGVWRVGSALDLRIEGQKDLAALKDQPVIPPSEKMFYPAVEGLRWREEKLFTGRYDL